MAKLHKIYNPMFDTLAFVKKLKVAGVPALQAEAQAEVLAETFSEAMDNKLATKQDILNLKQDILNLKQEFTEFKAEIKQDFATLKMDMIKWVLAISFMQAGLIISLLKLIH